MKKTVKTTFRIFFTLMLCFFLASAQTVAALAAETSEPEENTSSQVSEDNSTEDEGPNTLQLNLDPAWAGVEFELQSDTVDAVTMVTVSPEGMLTIDLDGSYIYSLNANSELIPVIPSQEEAAATSDEEEVEVAGSNTNEAESQPPDEENKPLAESEKTLLPGIPNLHLFLFAGGLVICLGILITMTVIKRRRENQSYDEDDDEYIYDDSEDG